MDGMASRRVFALLLSCAVLVGACGGADGVEHLTVECGDGTTLIYETIPASSTASAAHVRWRVGDAPWAYAPTGSTVHTRAVAACTG